MDIDKLLLPICDGADRLERLKSAKEAKAQIEKSLVEAKLDKVKELWLQHTDQHGCGDFDSPNFNGGTAHCPVANFLADNGRPEDFVALSVAALNKERLDK